MTKNVKNEVTVNPNPLHYPYPYYVKIADGDEASIKYYKRNGVPVSYIHLPHRMPHYYAVFNAASQEEADSMNRFFNNLDKKEYRDTKAQMEKEASYLAVFIIGVPDLGAVPASAVAAFYPAGECARAA